ncbi:hypothetical protein Cgig2_023003 [Carnegiea gigantea]|uniref:Uncharacterized protein n=1 Tax=Carnegiea gigantea TaxID=171969 RepID=A0A9Q1K9D6_9CARY|nr:hypothetical protein Cgig2_023003 [Carnegiea gigantea]
MDRDRSWMNHGGMGDKKKADNIMGVNQFLEYAFSATIHNHLIVRDILMDYNPWIHHGEKEVDEEIPLVRNDVEPDLIDVDLVDVGEDEEDEFSDRELDIDSLDRDLEDATHGKDNQLHALEPSLTCRQKRRAEQALRKGRKCEPTRGLQSLRERVKNPNVKPFATITEDMLRVVGKNANCFINHLIHVLPLCYKNWVRMDKDAKKRLFDKVQAEWNFSLEAKGIDVAHAVELQCMMLRHKDGKWDPEGEIKYEEFKKLYEDQIQKHGIDNLSLKEAYVEVLKEKLGYHRGLAPGPMPPKKGRNGGESNQIRAVLITKLQQLQQKEAALRGKLGELKVANLELKTNIEHMQKEAVERENKWKQEVIERDQLA